MRVIMGGDRRWWAGVIAGLLVFTVGGTIPAAGQDDPHSRCATYWSGMPGRDELRQLPPDMPFEGRGTPDMTPPPNPGLGDSWNWYIWHLAGAPWAELRSCTVRGLGENCYVVVEDTQWGVNVLQNDVDAIVARFDTNSVGLWPDEGVWDLNTSTFGDPPDLLDHDPRIYILYYDLDISADGFWWIYDEYPDGSQPYESNECEVVYINCSDNDPGSDYMISIVAHEFEHMIHWNQDPNEASWVDEGMGEAAMFLFGEPDPISGFPANPDNDLTQWGGAWADYIQTYLFMLYLLEQYGGRDMLSAVVSEPANSINGITNALATMGHSETFLDVFKDWGVANYLDDTGIYDGRYGYYNETLPHFFGTRHTSYPVAPPATTVSHWAADYITFKEGSPALDFDFDGNDTGNFALHLLRMGAGPTVVEEVLLDPVEDASVLVTGFGSMWDSVTVVVEDISSITATGYSYAADLVVPEEVPVGPQETARLTVEVLPQPWTSGGHIRYYLPSQGNVRIGIYAVDGRLVRRLEEDWQNEGVHLLYWDGRDEGGTDVSSGLYWARCELPETLIARPLVVVR